MKFVNLIKEKQLRDKSLNQIARELNIDVVIADLSKIYEERRIVNAFWLIDNKRRIYIDNNLQIEAKRYIYAFALWFFILNKKIENDTLIETSKKFLFVNYKKQNKTYFPNEKNLDLKLELIEFAENLLIPNNLLTEAIDVCWFNVSILSEYFKVPKQIIINKLNKDYKFWEEGDFFDF